MQVDNQPWQPSATWPPTVETVLPTDPDATVVGRAMGEEGPMVVTAREGRVLDLTAQIRTVRDLAELPDPAAAVRSMSGRDLGSVADLLAATPPERRTPATPYLLSPIDLQAVKAAGVTFAVSMLERVIEERCRGRIEEAERHRRELSEEIGAELSTIRPGSAEATRLKEVLVAQDGWSQYLEVGLGPDAEIFSKAPPMATVGTAVDIGLHPGSQWNNPEPEVVLLISSTGRIVGATLGNDVNLRDFEGRSALLLTKAKDNNASAALGPFVRLFDESFSLDRVREMSVVLEVRGSDGFTLEGTSSMTQISRDPMDLVTQLMGAVHQYPDGAVLYLGTMFAPVQDRDEPGMGFSHHLGDVVSISAPELGALVNRVNTSDRCEPWTFGVTALFESLARRGLLAAQSGGRPAATGR